MLTHPRPGGARWRIVASILLTLALLAPCVHAGPGLPPEVALPWTPARALLPDYCGPASLTSVLHYWGRPVDQATIGRSVFDRQRSATLAGDLILYAQQAGLQAISRSGSRDDLRRWLAAGVPIIVLQDLSAQDRRGHFRVVVGYSDLKRRFWICDCTEPTLCALSFEQFDDLWFHLDHWCLLVAPARSIAQAAPGDPDNPVLHFDLAEAYLRRGDRDAARQHLRAVLRLDPSHRLAGKLLAKLNRSAARPSTRRTDTAIAIQP